jgi:hypothetical protein
MNVNNIEFLKNGLKFMGFGETLNEDLLKNLREEKAAFSLNHVGEFKRGDTVDKVAYRLDFKKSDKTDMYFFNNYRATVNADDSEKLRTQMFYVNKNSGVTAKEAYNLLNGRAINKDLSKKDGEGYNAWLQLDLTEKDDKGNHLMKQYTAAYGYDIDKTLAKYPIKEAADPEQRTRILASLEKGNTVPVTFNKDGKEERMNIEANPRFKTLNLYDGKMQKVFQGIEKKEIKQESEKSKEKKESQKVEVDEEREENKGKRSRKGKGIGV